VLVVGLFLLIPIERSLLAGNSTAWVGAVAVLLAGVRALGVRLPDRQASAHDDTAPLVPSELVSATIAAQIGWALTGLLLTSQSGAAGALLLAVNLALTVPLLIVSAARAASGPRIYRVGLAIGVASLLGLPPLGAFAGTLQVAQAAATMSGFWLALLLLGSMLVAAKWLALTRSRFWILGFGFWSKEKPVEPKPAIHNIEYDTDLLLVGILSASQIALLALAAPLADTIRAFAVP
jgi:formate hydrogenlyase subunit 3/multisubunit Na+/H+ antiporter MnhD subunit